MAITLIQSLSAIGTASPATINFNAAAGNYLIAVLVENNSGAATQTAGQTMTSRRTYSNGGIRITFFSLADGTTAQEAAQDFTFTFTTTSWSLYLLEFSGINSAAPYDATAGAAADLAFTGTPSVTTPSPTYGSTPQEQADELILAAWNANSSGPCAWSAFEVGTDFLLPANGDRLNADAGGCSSVIGYRIVTALTTYQTDLTSTDTIQASASIVGFKAGAVAVDIPIPAGVLNFVGRLYEAINQWGQDAKIVIRKA